MSSVKTQSHSGITWVDVQNPTRADMESLAGRYNFHALHIEECLKKGQLPQAEAEPNYAFLLLHFPTYVKAEDRIVTSQVGVFVGKDFVVTVQRETAPSLAKLFKRCEGSEAVRVDYLQKSPGYVLYRIIGMLLQDIEDLLPAILEELEVIEDKVFDNQHSDAAELGRLRQKIMKLRRIIAALKTMLSDLAASLDGFAGEGLERYYRNNLKNTKRLWESIEEATETIEIYKDADFTANTEKTNDILAVLTLLFTLTIPATLLGTFYGMNILLPGGLQTGSWTFLGPYTTLIVVLVGSWLGGVIMWWYFRNRRWF